jgi:hypothetical protein
MQCPAIAQKKASIPQTVIVQCNPTDPRRLLIMVSEVLNVVSKVMSVEVSKVMPVEANTRVKSQCSRDGATVFLPRVSPLAFLVVGLVLTAGWVGLLGYWLLVLAQFVSKQDVFGAGSFFVVIVLSLGICAGHYFIISAPQNGTFERAPKEKVPKTEPVSAVLQSGSSFTSPSSQKSDWRDEIKSDSRDEIKNAAAA